MTEQSLIPEFDVFNLPVFADANIWGMWPADKLNELAEDIRENGFDHRYPITIAQVNGEWMLLDGRNRREAAKLVGIIPPVVVTDIDPKLAVHRSNNQNRDATPGQKAMATAMAFPEAIRGGDRKSSCFNQLDRNGFDKAALSRARYVRRSYPIPVGMDHPQICHDVMNGLLSLTEAVTQTDTYVEEQERQQRIRDEQAAKLADLRNRYPELASRIDDQFTLTDAIAVAESRDRLAAEQAQREQEEQARQLDWTQKIESIRSQAPDLADKMEAGKLDYESALRLIAERESIAKAQLDAALDGFYRFTEYCPVYATENGLDYLRTLSSHHEEYRTRCHRDMRVSLSNLLKLLDNQSALTDLVRELLHGY